MNILDQGEQLCGKKRSRTTDNKYNEENSVSLQRGQVPLYLRASAFYLSLSSDDNKPFSIPLDCFKSSPEVSTSDDLHRLLETMRFWGLNRIFSQLYVFSQTASDVDIQCCKDFADAFPFLDVLMKIRNFSKADKLKVALELGNTTVVKYLVDSVLGYKLKKELYIHAVKRDNLECVQFLVSRGLTLEPKLLSHCAEHGSFQSMKYIHQQLNFCTINGRVAYTAVRNNSIQCLQYAFEQGCKLGDTLCCVAAGFGALECLKYLRSVGVDWHSRDRNTNVCAIAAKYNHPLCMQYGLDNGCPREYIWVFIAAIKSGNCDCLKILFKLQTTPLLHQSEDLCALAARYGRLACLQLLREHGCNWGGAAESAARGGHLHCLRYAHEHGCEFLVNYVYRNIFLSDSVECLQYLLEKRCTHDTELCSQAAKAGAFNCLTYLIEHNYTLTELSCIEAIKSSNLNCLVILRQHGCPWSCRSFSAYYSSTASTGADKDSILAFLTLSNCPRT